MATVGNPQLFAEDPVLRPHLLKRSLHRDVGYTSFTRAGEHHRNLLLGRVDLETGRSGRHSPYRIAEL